MKEGVVLAGGNGTRLGRNRPYNKHLTLVYDRPMIEYPVQTLMDMGVEKGHIVSSESGVVDMSRTYGREINGLPVEYHVQSVPLGSAHALGHTSLEGVFPVLCGDVYFDPSPPSADKPTLYWTHYKNAANHSVYDPETNTIVEKPTRDLGDRAIVAYMYDERVYDVINALSPTERGELELIDLHNFYLQQGAAVKEHKGFFQDMGSPDGLLTVANYVRQKI